MSVPLAGNAVCVSARGLARVAAPVRRPHIRLKGFRDSTRCDEWEVIVGPDCANDARTARCSELGAAGVGQRAALRRW